MSAPRKIDIDLDDADDDGVAASQTPAGAGAVTLNGALGTTLDVARILIISSGSNISNRTFTFVGTDADGSSITEVVTGPNNSTVATTLFYKTVVSITISGSAAGAITIGTRGTTLSATSQKVVLDHNSSIAPTCVIDTTGTINVTVQECFDDVRNGVAPQWLPTVNMASKTADLSAVISRGATAVRCVVNTYSSGAEVQFYVAEVSVV